MWVLGKVGDREISVIDVFVGTVTLAVATYLAFGSGADAPSIKGAAFLLVLTFTCYWVAWNRWNGADGRGLGWFCLFVAITCALQGFYTAHTLWDYWFAICWVSWGVLWLLFYLLLAAGRTDLTRATGILCTAQGIQTGWIPGYLLLVGAMPGGPVPPPH